jgi:hypothetical protein
MKKQSYDIFRFFREYFTISYQKALLFSELLIPQSLQKTCYIYRSWSESC